MKSHESSNDTRVALVTGGSRGLGKNIALHLARDGFDVVITYRSQREEGEGVVAEIAAAGRRAAALKLDVGEVGEFPAFRDVLVQTLQSHWQRTTFNALVNNAGIDRMAPFALTTEEAFDSLMNVHFKGVYFLTQTLLPLIADSGRIVNISSGLARFAIPGYSAYGAMKGAIEVLTRYLAKELGPRKIGVNVVAPGVIETDFTREALSHPGAGFLRGQHCAGPRGRAR